MVFLVAAIACNGEVFTEHFRLTTMPKGYVVHPKYVIKESNIVVSLISCAIWCDIEMLCSYFVLSDSKCSIASKLVLARDAHMLGGVTGEYLDTFIKDILYSKWCKDHI